MARLSGALTGAAVIAVVLTFVVGDVFGYVSLLCSAGAFAAILAAHGELRRRRAAAQPAAEVGDTEPVDGDETSLDVLDVPEVEPEFEPEPEFKPEPEPEPERAPRPLRRRPAAAETELFPIEDYDWLTAQQICSVLSLLDIRELRQVRAREREGAARATVMKRIDQRIAVLRRRQRR